MNKELTQIEAIDAVADGLQAIADAMENQRFERCDFTGYSIVDSMGLIATSLSKIAEALENKGEGA